MDPTELFDAVLGIPDATLAELAVNDRAARSEALVACGGRDGQRFDEALAGVVAIDELFEQRLADL